MREEISLCDFPALERIIIQRNTMQYISSLRICNNSKLKEIVVEDSGKFGNENLDDDLVSIEKCRHDGSLLYANVTIES